MGTLSPGATFANGSGLHSVRHAYAATLTVVRRDQQSYGCSRYVVTDAAGHRGVAY